MGGLMYTAPMPGVSKQDQRVADAVRGHWADQAVPPALRPYARLARLERPIGWWLLLLPCWWGLLLGQVAAGHTAPDLRAAILFLIGAVAMRGAGCTLNDIVDRKIDAAVARTRSRPIPSGQVSVAQAALFLGLQCLVGLAVLVQFDRFSIVLAMASLAIVAVYPFMKRVTYWPQAVLGLAFNWGALVGWSVTHHALAWPALALYGAGIAWTLAYDTIYAHQDKEDDILIGVKSTALKFGDRSVYWIGGFFAVSLALLDLALWLAGAGLVAHVGIAAAALHASWQVARFDAGDADLCLRLFRANRGYGLLVTAFLLMDLVLP